MRAASFGSRAKLFTEAAAALSVRLCAGPAAREPIPPQAHGNCGPLRRGRRLPILHPQSPLPAP